MHSRLGNKIIEQISTLSEKEIFRAYLMAMKHNDEDLELKIARQLSHERRTTLYRYVALYELKVIALNALLVAKATIAIAYYNAYIAKAVGMEKVAESMDGTFEYFRQAKLDEISLWEQKLKEIEKEAGKALDLDDFTQLETLSKLFDFWHFANEYPTLTQVVRNVENSV